MTLLLPMPPKTAPICVLDKETQHALIEILDALGEESATIEIDGTSYSAEELRETVASCTNEMPEEQKKGKKKRGPRTPSEYNLYIGKCRTSKEKGGMGLDFKSCVEQWNERKEK